MPSDTELAEAFVTAANLPAGYTVERDKPDPAGPTGPPVKADRTACQPLADLLSASSGTAGKPSAIVDGTAKPGNPKVAGVRIRLAAYPEGKAWSVVDSVVEAASVCTAGFTGTYRNHPTPFKVTPDPSTGGEQSAGVVLTGAFGRHEAPIMLWVIRTGNVVGFFASLPRRGESVGYRFMTAVTAPQVGMMASVAD